MEKWEIIRRIKSSWQHLHMNQEDDPEARIRQLEQPLANTAGSSAYTSPHASQYAYNATLSNSRSRSFTGARVWWIVAAFLVVGVLTLVGVIVTFTAHRLSSGSLVVLSPTSAPGLGTTSPRTTPLSAPPPPSGNLNVSGINENRVMACNDNNVNVSGVANTVIITGRCASVTVSGVQNAVTVDAAETIAVSGFNNRITYHSGSPKVTKAGDSNVVQRG